MSDPQPIPDPVEVPAHPSAEATPSGPVPGRLDLDRPAAAPHDPGALSAPGRLTPPPDPGAEPADPPDEAEELPHLQSPRRGRRLVAKPATPTASMTPQQRLLILDTWQRSGLPAGDFAPLVGVSKYTLYSWKQRFEAEGPAGLMDQPRGCPGGSKLPELTRRTILMIKQANPEFGCQKISDLLLRGPALPASPAAVARVLHEAGYQFEEVTTRPHPDRVRSFERARPNQLWQTDLFTFMLDHAS
jgi:transposase